MEIYSENITSVLVELVKRVQAEYSTRTGAKYKKNTNQDAKILNDLGSGISGLHRAAPKFDSACERNPNIEMAGRVDENWISLSIREIQEFNRNGADYVNSCTEALIKTHGIMNCWFQDPAARGKLFFRGETCYGWNLIPRVGRNGCRHNPNYPLSVTADELGLLDNFQTAVRADQDFQHFIFEHAQLPENDDASWWSIMQHYDQHHGTRMIDLTSSLYCGLYFACANWDGSIDDSVDGALYLIPDGAWRAGTNVNDVNQYFSVQAHLDILRFNEGIDRNDRLVAQDSFFIWQPKFDEPMNLGQHFKFRVFREAKENILRELYSIGYTARRIVRGSVGDQAHDQLCNRLGVPPR